MQDIRKRVTVAAATIAATAVTIYAFAAPVTGGH